MMIVCRGVVAKIKMVLPRQYKSTCEILNSSFSDRSDFETNQRFSQAPCFIQGFPAFQYYVTR